VLIRPAAPDELAAVGDLTVDAYAAEGYLDYADDYADELRDAARRAELATLLVAVDERSGAVVGTATFFLAGTPYAEVSRPGEAEFRMLAVAKEARGQGVAAALVQSCIERARAAGSSALALCSLKEMTPAHRIYLRMGFVRAPDRDWDPLPGLTLVAFVLPLQPAL
jgi:GNAT superfamily N-acetyltransferase